MALRFNKFIFLLPVLAAALLILGFSDRAFWWIVFFALAPLFLFIQKSPSKKSAFWGGLLCGFVFQGFLVSYFFSAYPLDWAGISGPWELVFIFLIWSACAFTLALSFGFFAWVAKIGFKNFGFFEVWVISAFWVVSEYFKSWSLSIAGIGPGSVLGPHWGIGHIGYALSNSPQLLQLTSWGGVYLLSFIAAAANSLIYWFASAAFRKAGLKTLALRVSTPILFAALVFFLGNWELKTKVNSGEDNARTVKAALIQTDFPSAFREDFSSRLSRVETLLNLLEDVKGRQERFDIIVMNERHHFLKSLLNTQSYAKSQKIFSDFPADILVDVKAGRTGSEQSSLLFYFEPATNRLIAEQEKIMLLPGGEYMPYLIRLFASLIGGTDWLEDFLSVRGYEKGGELKVVDLGFGKVGGLLCSEILSPVLYRSFTKQGAELLINVASDSVFRGNPFLLSQNLAMAKVRAAESNRYFLQATNAGFSYVIDNKGEVLAGGKNKGNEAVLGEAKMIPQPSFYAKTGDWVVVLSAAFAIANLLRKRRGT